MHALSLRGGFACPAFYDQGTRTPDRREAEIHKNATRTMKSREEKKEMRKYKQVKEKKVTYELDEWEEVERRARKLKMKTGTYIKRISVDGKVEYCDVGELAPLVKEVNAIGVNVNQLARKANELNSIYAGDMEKMKELIETLCRMLSSFACTRQWSRV